jgi:hypothetical protein
MAIDTVKIFPAIGIARLGNSPAEFYIGPEIPGAGPTPPGGTFKDANCQIKRQAARFRLYGYSNGVLQGEVTSADADITWTVELANTKADWKQFGGVEFPNLPPRNQGVANRASLKITPGPRTLNGPNQSALFDSGTFMGVQVPLGEIRTDNDGHLLVLGGFGNSASPTNAPLKTFANNDGWHDDVSDGPVTATVKLKNSNMTLQAVPAWVICPPTRFAPAIYHIKTLYDTLLQVAVDKFNYPVNNPPSFTNDVYPLLNRAMRMRWVSAVPGAGHTVFGPVIPPPGAPADRANIFGNVRDPATAPHVATPNSDMPKIWSDVYDTFNMVNEALTPTQYAILKNWANGNFNNDWVGPPQPGNNITPDGLTQAALENCIGGAFYPGIETSFMIRDTYPYLEPFRLDASQLSPGDLTKQNAVPWQADFYDCSFDTGFLWWPAARPDDVFPENGGAQVQWIRDWINSADDMVQYWHKLGFVVQQGNQVVETERCASCFLILDKSTFGQDEVELGLPGTAYFKTAFWVGVDGFTGAELNFNAPGDLNNANPNPQPAVTYTIDPVLNPTLTPAQVTAINNMLGIEYGPPPVTAEDPTLALRFQRFLYPFTISFNGDGGFTALQANQVAIVTIHASITAGSVTRTASANIELTRGEDPYYQNVNLADPNQPFWLSFDLRFFKVRAGDTHFGVTMSGNVADAPGYIANVLTNLNMQPAPGGDTFDALAQDEDASALEFLQRDVANNLVFNFAVARVRLIGKTPGAQAKAVRVFFRLFQAQTVGSDFNEQTTYRFSSDGITYGNKIPLLGIENNEYVTVPCFATARVDTTAASMTTQTDASNVRTINVNPGIEVDTYFGCWIDANQPQQKVLPQTPPGGNADGPWNGGMLFSINEAITRSPHQCMIAEIRFDDTPVPAGATSATSDKLAQRNIAWIDGPNPGTDPSRRMPHPVELKPSRKGVLVPDELMILWGGTPAGSTASLYLPAASAADILKLANGLYVSHQLTMEDANTVGFPVGGVTFVPLPEGTGRTAGLLTVNLGTDLHRGQIFNIAVRQITEAAAYTITTGGGGGIHVRAAVNRGSVYRWRLLLGAFQFTLTMRTKAELLLNEERLYAWLLWIYKSIPKMNRWYPVWQRYIAQIGGRVEGFGGNPGQIQPSPTGTVPQPGGGTGPEREKRRAYTGKIAGLIFDRYGDFEGFVMDTEEREHKFYSREPDMEDLASRAWRERLRITVWSERDEPHRPLTILIDEPPALFR